MTGDLRKELEKQYEIAAAAAARKKQSPKSEPTEPNGGIVDSSYQDAPRSYKKEYAEMFKQLPPAMRKYLHERESEIERGFSRLNNELSNHRWIDEAYSSRSERLCKNGICKAQDWVEAMALVDDALDKNPTDRYENIGIDALKDYIMFVYAENGLVVFESFIPGNAYYVFKYRNSLVNLLEEITNMSKTQMACSVHYVNRGYHMQSKDKLLQRVNRYFE